MVKGKYGMNILFITWNFPPKTGGIENVVYNVWRGLRKTNNVYVITSYAKQVGNDETQVVRPPVPGILFFLFFSLIKGSALTLKKDIDVIFSGSGVTSFIVVILGKLFRRKTATDVHGLDLIYPNFFYQFMISVFLPKVDYIIANSEESRKNSIKRGVPKEKIGIIHPGVNSEKFGIKKNLSELREVYRLKNRIVVLNVGRLARRKGIIEFIRNSFFEITQEFPEVTFVIAGGNPTDALAHKSDVLSDIKAEVKKLKLENNVKILGKVSEKTKIELYSLCDIFVLPVIPVEGDVEGFGMVFIEAGAAGKPVIGTRVGGIPDAVENGKSGILVEANDYQSLTKEMIKLLKDPVRMKRMGDYGRERAIREFDWNVINSEYEQVLKQLCLGELN